MPPSRKRSDRLQAASPRSGRGCARLGLALVGALVLASFGAGCASSPRPEPELDTDGLPPHVLAALDVVTGLQDAMLGIMRRGPELGYPGRVAAIAAIARVSFDIPAMARASYGPGFAELTAEQKARLLDVFERFHVSALADVRDRYQGQTYRILGYDEPGAGVVLIRSKLDYPGRAVDLYIDYRLRRTPDGWQIFDVHDPPSVSEVAMRRAEYRTVLERYGFDGLIAEMESRIARREQR